MIKLYVSKISDTYNNQVLNTELYTEYVCLNPNYKNVTLQRKVNILMDSGAYQDRVARKDFVTALRRQLQFEKKLGLVSDKIVAYDLIDDVDQTVLANNFIAKHRQNLSPRTLVLVLQGKTREEYMRCFKCTQEVLTEDDCVGFGGFSKSSVNRTAYLKLMHVLHDILPELRELNVKKIHFFGIANTKVLKIIENACLGFEVSVDASTLEMQATKGRVFNTETFLYDYLEQPVDISSTLATNIKGINFYLQAISCLNS